SDTAAGEVHVLAGSLVKAVAGGKSTDDTLKRLRVMSAKHFRITQCLPDPGEGNLTRQGPESGTLKERPLVHLMRYCEVYLITCAIEVSRSDDKVRIEYKRGEIRA